MDQLGTECNTDKASTYSRSGAEARGHGYLRHYQSALKAMGRNPRIVLDLGVGDPEYAFASARMWERYFPDARIVAVDIHERPLPADTRIEFLRLDLGDPRSLARLAALGADLIVEDASHRWMHQVMSLLYLFPSVPSGGLFILEDLATSNESMASAYADAGFPNPAKLVAEVAGRLAVEGLIAGVNEAVGESTRHPQRISLESYVVDTVLPLIDSLQVVSGSALFRMK